MISLTTADWKKREQYDAGILVGPDDNLQLHAYSIARGTLVNADRYRNALVLFGDGEVDPIYSRWYPRREWGQWIERIRAVQVKPPIAHPGAHCHSCYQRGVCSNYRERAALAMAVIGEQLPDKLSDNQAAELVMRAQLVQAAAKLALEMAQAHVESGGRIEADGKLYRPVAMPGRKSADIKGLERDGLGQYVKKGEGYSQWRWLKGAGR